MFDDAGEQGFLGLEIMAGKAAAISRLMADFRQGKAVRALFGDQLDRGGEQPAFGFLTTFLLRTAHLTPFSTVHSTATPTGIGGGWQFSGVLYRKRLSEGKGGAIR